MQKSHLTAAIIAGGASRRFGERKALALLHGRPLIEYAIDTAESISDTIILNFAEKNYYKNKKILAVRDIVPGCGPLGGIYSVLYHAATPWVAMLPCDMPLLSGAVYHCLHESRLEGRPVVARSENGIEPLVSIWPKSLAAALGSAIDAGDFGLHLILERLHAQVIDLRESYPEYRPELFLNVNRRTDLEAIERFISAKGLRLKDEG